MKQVILMRRDLCMTRGKEIAQGAHASMITLLEYGGHPLMREWLADRFTKVALSVGSEDELMDLIGKARVRGMITSVVTDAGLTMFGGVPTVTCGAIGPDHEARFVGLTDHLKLR